MWPNSIYWYAPEWHFFQLVQRLIDLLKRIGVAVVRNGLAPSAVRDVFIFVTGPVSPKIGLTPLSATVGALAASTSPTLAHVVDPGTDLLVVGVSTTANLTSISGITWTPTGGSAQAMTSVVQFGNGVAGSSHTAIFTLRLPVAGSGVLSISSSNAALASAYGMACNFWGSKASGTIRNYLGDASLPHAHSVVAGDYLFEVLRNGAALTAADGQTVYNGGGQPFGLEKIDTTGTDTLNWSGTTSYLTHSSIAIAGS